MKVIEILEGLSRVAKREFDNPHPSAINDPDDVAWIYGDSKLTVRHVIEDILGDLADFTGEPENEKQFVVSGPWVSHHKGMFDTMDMPPGTGGAIGVPDLDGNKPEDIATAAHEAFHAKLQSRSKNYRNEKVVNRLTTRWLQDHLSGMFLHMAIESILQSKRSYAKFKYEATRRFLAQHKESQGNPK